MVTINYLDDFYYSEETADVTFYLDVNGTAFPDSQWTDFAVIVLNWWITETLAIHQTKNAKFRLRFMDGPYYVECFKQGEKLHMDCIEDRNRDIGERSRNITVCECDVDFNEFIRELADATRGMIDLVEMQNFGKLQDFEDLKESYKRLLRVL